MNQPKPAMFFQVIRRFDIKGGGEGVILLDVRSEKEAYYVANANDVPNPNAGAYIEIPCRKRGDAIVVPNELFLVWTGPMGNSSKAIRLQYLANLYNGPLHASRQASFSIDSGMVEKTFDSKEVFQHPILRLLESLHDLLNTPSLHEQLVETNYQYNRMSVYTRFHDDPEDLSYKTPRSLNYYPMENLVRVTFSLGGVPDDISVQVKEDKFENVKVMPAMVNIIRTFRNEGWTSLRDLARKEPQLKAFIKMFYDNGYGKPEVPEHLRK
jgi:hypothetical protein